MPWVLEKGKAIKVTNMTLIPTKPTGFAKVDDEDAPVLLKQSWHRTPKGYVRNGKNVPMHRLILGVGKGVMVDHKNHDPSDNRRENIRLCDRSQNNANRRVPVNNSSGYKGVNWHELGKRWRAEIKYGGKKRHLGLFHNKEDAARAYNEAVKKVWGEFASLNEIST